MEHLTEERMQPNSEASGGDGGSGGEEANPPIGADVDPPSEEAEHIHLDATLGSVDDDDEVADGAKDDVNGAAVASASEGAEEARADAAGAAGAAEASPSGASSVMSSADPSPDKLVAEIVADDMATRAKTGSCPTRSASADAYRTSKAASDATAGNSIPDGEGVSTGQHHGHAAIDRAPPATGHEFDNGSAAVAAGEDEISTPQHDDDVNMEELRPGNKETSSRQEHGSDDATPSAAAASHASSSSAAAAAENDQGLQESHNSTHDFAHGNYAQTAVKNDNHQQEDDDERYSNRSDTSDDVSSINSFPGPSATSSRAGATTPASPPPVPPSTPISYLGQKTVLGPDHSMSYVGKGHLKSPPLAGRTFVGEGGGGFGPDGRPLPPPPFGMEETPVAASTESQDGVTTPPRSSPPGEAHVDVPTPSESAIDAEVNAMPTEKRRGGHHGGAGVAGVAGTAAPEHGTKRSPETAASAATTSSTAARPKKRARKTHTEDFTTWEVGKRYELMRILGRGSYGEVAQAKDLTYRPAPSPTNIPGHPAHVHDQTPTEDTAQQRQPEPDDTHDYPDNHGHGPYVAVKRISGAFDQEIDAVRLYREMHILRRLRGHECIINLIDVIEPANVKRVGAPPASFVDNDDDDDNNNKDSRDGTTGDSPLSKRRKQKYQYPDLTHFTDLYMVFDYVDTDLYKLIMSPQYLTTEHIQTFLYQMLTGIKYIHSASVIHRDLKPVSSWSCVSFIY